MSDIDLKQGSSTSHAPLHHIIDGLPRARSNSTRSIHSIASARDTRPWLSRIRSMLRLLIAILSTTVACTLFHTYRIYKGNFYIDLLAGEQPMVWPARTNLVATWFLFGVAVYNLTASAVIMLLAYKRSFRRPIKRRDLYRVVAGSAGVVLWGAGMAVFSLVERGHTASLGRYACANRNVMSNGRYQYKAVCSEQVWLTSRLRGLRIEASGVYAPKRRT